MKTTSRTVLLALFLASVVSAQPPAQPARQFPPRNPNPPGRPALPPVNTDPITAPPRETAAAPLDLSGSWKGVYCPDYTVAIVDLELTADAAKRKVTGELRYRTIPPPGTGARPTEGSWKVTGVVDPGAHTVMLAPDGVVGPRLLGATTNPERMSAVYSAKRGELAGQFQPLYNARPDLPHFLFVRAEAGARVKALGEHASTATPPLRVSGSAPSDEAIVSWAARFIQEYGSSTPGGTVDQTGAKALPLLNDATFKPVFGESYDTIDCGRLAAAMRRLGGTFGGGNQGFRPDQNFVRDNGYIQYIIAPTPTKIVWVAAMRAIDAWKSEMLAHLRDDPPVASAFDDLAALQKAIKERVVYAWPSERKATDQAIEQIRSRLGSSALLANADRAIAGASGLAGAKTLASWATTNTQMLQYSPAADRTAAQQRIDAALDKLLEGLLVEPMTRLDKFISGAGALRDGATWYRSLMSQFAFAGQRPPVQKAVARLSARRDQDLTAGYEQLVRQIAACKKTEDVDALFSGDLSVPGDDTKRLYGALADAGRKRKAEIQQDFMMSLFSKQEVEWMDRPGHIDMKKGAGMAPSPESVRLALLRGWAHGTGKMLDAHTARHVTRMSPLFIPYPMQVSMTNEEMVDFLPSKDGKEFECRYRILTQFLVPQDNMLANYDAVVRRGIDDQIKAFNVIMRAASAAVEKDVFRLYDDGWGVPRLRENGAVESVLDGLLRARQ